LEDIEITYSNYTRLARFESVRKWSVDETIDLMRWHISNERRIRKGWNNSLSLINHSICDGEISWSMMLVRNNLFIPSIVVILPFKAVPDHRMMIRMSTTFSSVTRHSRWFNMDGDEIIGQDRIILTHQLVTRIIDGFGWSGNLYDYKVRRYRLIKLLENNKRRLSSDLDCHHATGHSSGKLEHIIDDTSKNIKILDKSDHHSLHHCFGDTNFVDYRFL
jgi:hypothetical protein